VVGLSQSGQVVSPIICIKCRGCTHYAKYDVPNRNHRNIVYNLSGASINKISVDPKIAYSVCLLSGPNVYTISKEEFAKVIMANGNKFNVQK